jgi:hypothetical protein
VDYPNSNKAKKVFWVLMVGSGGQIPQGLQGDVEGVVNEDQAKFERRRERAKARSSMKKKNVKGKDWVLKKKEVSSQLRCPFRGLTDSSITLSCIDNEGKRMFPGTRSTLLGSERLASDIPVPLPIPPRSLIHRYVCYDTISSRDHRPTNNSLVPLTASSGSFLMKVPWRAAMLTLLPSFA